MKAELLRFKKGQKYVLFDYETCDLNLGLETNKPWQLSFILASGDSIVEKHDYYLKWDDLKLSEDAARITGFSKRTYDSKAVCPKKALAHFEKYLYNPDYINVGHNILGFDVYIHNIHRMLCGKKPDYSYIARSIDTLCLGKAIKKEIKFPKGGDRLAWQYSLNSVIERGLKASLSACAKYYGIDFDSRKLHNALYDISINYSVFKKMLWDLEI
jgi:DNA polymerase III epsilon subunit-like protein